MDSSLQRWSMMLAVCVLGVIAQLAGQASGPVASNQLSNTAPTSKSQSNFGALVKEVDKTILNSDSKNKMGQVGQIQNLASATKLKNLKDLKEQSPQTKSEALTPETTSLDKQTLIKIISNPDSVLPSHLRELGSLLIKESDLQEGLFWYQLGRLRTLQDLNLQDIPQEDSGKLCPPFLSDTELQKYQPELKEQILHATRRAVDWDRGHKKQYNRNWIKLGEPSLQLARPKLPSEDANADENLRADFIYEAMQMVEGENVNLFQPEEK